MVVKSQNRFFSIYFIVISRPRNTRRQATEGQGALLDRPTACWSLLLRVLVLWLAPFFQETLHSLLAYPQKGECAHEQAGNKKRYKQEKVQDDP